MARCKLTRMSLRNIRKDKQYQCIVIDFVRTGVISKSKAEELLNYTIPAGLLEGSVAAPDDEDEPGTGTGEGSGTGGDNTGTGGNESGTGGETSGETGGETEDTIILNLIGAFMYDDSGLTLDNYTTYDPSGNTPVQVQVPAALVASLNTKFADDSASNSVSDSDTDLVSFVNILKTAVDAAAAEQGATDSSQIYEARMCTLEGSDFYLAKAVAIGEGSPTNWSIGNVYYDHYDSRVVRNNSSTGSGEIKDGDTYFVSIKYTDGE